MLQKALTFAAPPLFVLLWSTGFIGSKLGAPYADPMVFLSLRFLLVLPFLLLIIQVTRATWAGSIAQIGHCIITGMLVHGIYLGGVFWAIDNGMPAGSTAIIVGLQPVLSVLAAFILLREPIRAMHWAGLFLGGLGLVMVLGPKLGATGSGVDTLTILAVIGAVIAISIGTVYQKRFVPRTALLTATFWQYVGALAFCLPFTVHESWSVEWTAEFVFALVWLVFVLSIGAILLLMVLIRQGAVSEVASLFYLVPVATSIESFFLFGEILSILQIGGMLLIICAVLLIRLKAPGKTSSGDTGHSA